MLFYVLLERNPLVFYRPSDGKLKMGDPPPHFPLAEFDPDIGVRADIVQGGLDDFPENCLWPVSAMLDESFYPAGA